MVGDAIGGVLTTVVCWPATLVVVTVVGEGADGVLTTVVCSPAALVVVTVVAGVVLSCGDDVGDVVEDSCVVVVLPLTSGSAVGVVDSPVVPRVVGVAVGLVAGVVVGVVS